MAKKEEKEEKPYEDLRIDILENWADHYGLDYKKNNKKDVITQIRLYEDGKIKYGTITTKMKDGWWYTGIDPKNHELSHIIGKLVEKKEAIRLGRCYQHRIWYKLKEKPLL